MGNGKHHDMMETEWRLTYSPVTLCQENAMNVLNTIINTCCVFIEFN